MRKLAKLYTVIVVALGASSLAYADPCQQSAAHLQHEVDGVIEEWVSSGPWRPESVDALRGRQPTPQSIAAAAANANDFEGVLDALDRARAAGSVGNAVACNQELANVRAELRRYGR